MSKLTAKNSTKFSNAPRRLLTLTKEQKYLICEYKTKYPKTKLDILYFVLLTREVIISLYSTLYYQTFF